MDQRFALLATVEKESLCSLQFSYILRSWPNDLY